MSPSLTRRIFSTDITDIFEHLQRFSKDAKANSVAQHEGNQNNTRVTKNCRYYGADLIRFLILTAMCQLIRMFLEVSFCIWEKKSQVSKKAEKAK